MSSGPDSPTLLTSNPLDIDAGTSALSFPKLPPPKSKKQKATAITPTENKYKESLTIIKTTIDTKPEEFPLTSLQIENFLEETQGVENIQEVLDEFEIKDSEMIDVPERGLKSRFTRIMNKLKKGLRTETNDEYDATTTEGEMMS